MQGKKSILQTVKTQLLCMCNSFAFACRVWVKCIVRQMKVMPFLRLIINVRNKSEVKNPIQG